MASNQTYGWAPPANGQVQSFALRPPLDLILAAHVQGLPVDEFEYGGLAGERGFEPLIG